MAECRKFEECGREVYWDATGLCLMHEKRRRRALARHPKDEPTGRKPAKKAAAKKAAAANVAAAGPVPPAGGGDPDGPS